MEDKSMQFNRIFSAAFAAGIVLATVACQKVDEISSKSAQTSEKSLTVTATIADIDGTKVSYSFDENNAQKAIKQEWDVGDQIFGFDDEGGTFTFEVKSVEEGVATFVFAQNGNNIAQDAATLYAVYYPGKTVDMINNKTLDVDLTANNGVLNGDGDTKAPVIMCATASIENGKIDFVFKNQTAIVGIYKMQIFDGEEVVKNTEISSVTLSGVYTSGTIKLDGDNFGLVANAESTKSITARATLSTDDNGVIDANFSGEGAINAYFSVIPGEYNNIIVTARGLKTYTTNGSISGTLSAGWYYYIGKQISVVPVATIEGTEYFTISDAFNAVQNGQTITLLQAPDENGWKFDDEIKFPAEKWSSTSSITLNLNGQKLSGEYVNGNGNGKNTRIVLDNENVTLTIKGGGTITSTNGNADIIKVEAGHLVVNGATIAAKSQSDKGGNAAIWVQGPEVSGEQTNPNASVTIKSGSTIKGAGSLTGDEPDDAYAIYVNNTNATVTIEGGTFSSQSNNVKIVNAKNDNGAGVSITGGTFTCETSGNPTLWLEGNYTCNIGDDEGNGPVVTSKSNPITVKSNDITLNVGGGKFKTESTSAAIIAKGNNTPTISVSGGKFSKSIAYMADNHTCCKTELENDYPWEVVNYGENDALVITAGSWSYTLKSSINDAVDAANTSGGKIILVNDCTVTGTSAKNVTKNVTLDLNGKTLKQNKGGRVGVTTDGVLTITDSQTGGKITQVDEATNQYTISIAGGTLNVDGGTISSISDMTVAAVNISGGNLNVNEGAITGIGSHALNISGGAVTINNGTITANATTKNAVYVSASNAEVKIKGGLIESTSDKGDSRTYTIDIYKLVAGSFVIYGGDFRSKDRIIYSRTSNEVGVQILKLDGCTEPRFYSYDNSGSESSKVNLFYCPKPTDSNELPNKISCAWGYYGCASDKACWSYGGYLADTELYKLTTYQTKAAKFNNLEYWRRVVDK